MEQPRAILTPCDAHGHCDPAVGVCRRRKLAASLNNVAARRHGEGSLRTALAYYQEAVTVRMEALRVEMGGDGEKPATDDKVVSARYEVVRKEEEVFLRSPKPKSTRLLDLYPEDAADACQRMQDANAVFAAATESASFASLPPQSDPLHIAWSASAANHGLSSATSVPSLADEADLAPEEKTQIEDNRSSAITLYNMGLVHSQNGTLSKAAHLFQMASSVVPASSDPVLGALILNNLALIDYRRGDPSKALKSLREALLLEQGIFGAKESMPPKKEGFSADLEDTISSTLSLMGRIHYTHGDPHKALELAHENLRLIRSSRGDSDISVAAVLHNVGLILRATGRAGDALEHVTWFVKTALETLPDAGAHPQVAAALGTLGTLQLENGLVSKAIESLSHSVAVRRAACGSDHAEVADALMALGRVHQDTGSYVQALELYREAVRIYSSVQGRESEDVASALCHMGQVRHGRGELSEALAIYEEVLRISRALLGDRNEYVADLLGVIGNVCLEMGETEDAMANFADARRIMDQVVRQRGVRPTDTAAVPTPVVVPNLYQAMLGFEFHPCAAAA